MIPDIVAVVFLLVPFACLVYIFRGMGDDANPLWGNILAAAIGAVVAAMVAIWFFSGTIVSPSIVNNATYQLPTNVSVGEMINQQSALTGTSNKLGAGGSGMFMRSSVSSASGQNLTNLTTISVHTYDIVYQQYQDFGMMFVYILVAVVSLVLFLWYIQEMRHALQDQDEYENSGLGGE